MAVAATLLGAGADAVPDEAAGPRVLAHYMPWFRAEPQPDGTMAWDHWQWFGKGTKHDPSSIRPDGRRDIASVYDPLIGPYDGRDPDVLEYHFLSARAAGIEGFIADWYGPGVYTDEVFARMLPVAEAQGMKVAVCLEEKSFYPDYAPVATREEAVDEMVRQVRYVLDRYAGSPAYWHHGGKPVLLMFRNHKEGRLGRHVLRPDELKRAIAMVGRAFQLVPGHADAEYVDAARATFSWLAETNDLAAYYASAQELERLGRIDLWMASVNPGFDDSGVWGWGNGPRLVERRGFSEYLRYWEAVRQHKPAVVQVVTWNDFGEGTTIEPAHPYGFDYLDVTEQQVEAFTGRRADLRDNAWPYRIYRLRRALADVEDQARRDASRAALDAFVEGMREGRRFLMNWKLRRLEQKLNVEGSP